jgi:hypothetical protein
MSTLFSDDIQKEEFREGDVREGAIQAGTDKCPNDPHNWTGSDPHANFEQMHPAVNKKEPSSFANPCESGAKKASEDVYGKPMPVAGVYT